MWESRNYLNHHNSEVHDELFLDKINLTIEVLHKEGQKTDLLFPVEQKFFRNDLDKVLKQNKQNKVL